MSNGSLQPVDNSQTAWPQSGTDLFSSSNLDMRGSNIRPSDVEATMATDVEMEAQTSTSTSAYNLCFTRPTISARSAAAPASSTVNEPQRNSSSTTNNTQQQPSSSHNGKPAGTAAGGEDVIVIDDDDDDNTENPLNSPNYPDPLLPPFIVYGGDNVDEDVKPRVVFTACRSEGLPVAAAAASSSSAGQNNNNNAGGGGGTSSSPPGTFLGLTPAEPFPISLPLVQQTVSVEQFQQQRLNILQLEQQMQQMRQQLQQSQPTQRMQIMQSLQQNPHLQIQQNLQQHQFQSPQPLGDRSRAESSASYLGYTTDQAHNAIQTGFRSFGEQPQQLPLPPPPNQTKISSVSQRLNQRISGLASQNPTTPRRKMSLARNRQTIRSDRNGESSNNERSKSRRQQNSSSADDDASDDTDSHMSEGRGASRSRGNESSSHRASSRSAGGGGRSKRRRTMSVSRNRRLPEPAASESNFRSDRVEATVRPTTTAAATRHMVEETTDRQTTRRPTTVEIAETTTAETRRSRKHSRYFEI